MGAHEVPPPAAGRPATERAAAGGSAPAAPADDLSDRSLGDLLSQLTSDLSRLVRQELELAKAEVRQEATTAAKAGAMLGAGAVAAYLALLLVSFAAAWGLAEIMAPGFAFLIVGVVHAAVAAVLVMAGRKRLADVDPVPQQTVDTVKEDAQWAKNRMS